MRFKKLIFVFVIILIFIITLFTLADFLSKSLSKANIVINTSSINDITYTFDKNELGNGTFELNNLKHYDKITGNYNATFTFTSESDYSNPNNWTISDETGGSINIYPTFNQHDKVLELNDTSAVNLLETYQQHDPQITGRYELWMSSTDVTYTNYVIFHNSLGASDFGIRLYNDIFEYYDGTWNALGKPANDNQWYHIAFVFSCISDTYYLYVNEIEYGSFSMRTNIDNVNYIRLLTHTTFSNYKLYIDALGYTWNSYYSQGDNIIPLTESIASNLLSNDKYEFDLNENGIPLAYSYENQGRDYSTNLKDWTIVDPSGTNKVYVQNGWYLDYNGYNVDLDDNAVIIDAHYFSGSVGGIKNDTLSVNGLDYRININMRFQAIGSIASKNRFIFYAFGLDTNEIIRWRLQESSITYGEFDVQTYGSGSWTTRTTLIGCGNPNNTYTFITYPEYSEASNQYLYSVLIYQNNTFFDDIIGIDFLNNSYGISEIDLYANSTLGGIWTPRLENVELLNHNISICNEKGYAISNTRLNTWYSFRQNLVFINNINYGTTFIYGNHYIDGWSYFSISNKTVDNLFYNFYFNFTHYSNASLYVVNNDYINNSVNYEISGVSLQENTNYYYPVYYYSSYFNGNESYYYVENNRLYYYFNVSNSTAMEYMALRFIIPNTYTNNYTFKTSYIKTNSYLFSELRIYYYDTSYSFFSAELYTITLNTILPQDKYVNSIYYIITDDNNTYTGMNTGYFSSIIFVYTPDLSITISTLSLLGIIPILIYILAIPILVVVRTKLKWLFIPIVIVMAGISMVYNIVPVWLGVIIIILSISYYFIKRKSE